CMWRSIVRISSIMCVLMSTSNFFFSSRRRHTRSKRDWSSDVCSSDLVQTAPVHRGSEARRRPPVDRSGLDRFESGSSVESVCVRLEERRVGQRCVVLFSRGGGKNKSRHTIVVRRLATLQTTC